MSLPPPMPVKRSTFVTVTAWIFIGLSGFMALIGILQNIMLQMLFVPAMHQQPAPDIPPGMPPQMLWMFGHFEWFFRFFLLLALTHLVAAITLLLRRNWGRMLFIGVLVFDCVYQLASVALQWWMINPMMQMMQAQMQDAPQAQSADFAQSMQIMDGMMSVMRIFSLVISLGFIALFAWIIRRLHSAAIRREFQPPLATPTGSLP
ncbi:hypothetical protein [Rhodanobacter sp. L36]|uniref:hypothetical protein n=1 Tax=Rhodanobacter sp. L36 TaxID=1747221 RepID=UPI00131DC365|nr:hypothetical protein [Rhodanobacter sp. L36]